ncbi:MAG: hypothetical protein H6711_09815 [Myxococcales bacterium]|nr:hypothetical protein [Myxococcales bacterium]
MTARVPVSVCSVFLLLVACSGDDGGSGGSESAGSTSGLSSGASASPTTTLTSGASGSGSGGESEGTSSGGDTTSGGTSTGGDTTTSTGGSTGVDSGTTTGGGEPSDEDLLRMAIEGELDPGDVMQQIADGGGFPVKTEAGTFMFACLCGPGTWALVGDHNQWAPDVMMKAGALWWTEVEIADPDGSLYKFHDTIDAYIPDPMGRRYGYDNFGEFSLVRASAPHLERWYGLEGYGLEPRDVQVYVPQDAAFTHVVYAHDGQNLFDPDGIWGGWKLQESVPPEMLVVGVDNTPARMDEYTHTTDKIGGQTLGGKGSDYAKLVHEELRPRMEAAYGAPLRVGLMGSSLGGLISLYIADQYASEYDMTMSLSGTAGWGSIGAGLKNPTIRELYEMAGKRDFAIYLDHGGDDGGMACVDSDMDGTMDDNDLASDNYCENLQLRDALIDLGYTSEVDLWHYWEPGAPHNEAAWAARVGIPLGLFADL